MEHALSAFAPSRMTMVSLSHHSPSHGGLNWQVSDCQMPSARSTAPLAFLEAVSQHGRGCVYSNLMRRLPARMRKPSRSDDNVLLWIAPFAVHPDLMSLLLTSAAARCDQFVNSWLRARVQSSNGQEGKCCGGHSPATVRAVLSVILCEPIHDQEVAIEDCSKSSGTLDPRREVLKPAVVPVVIVTLSWRHAVVKEILPRCR